MTPSTAAADAPRSRAEGGERERVAVLLANRENQRLLGELLEGRYTVSHALDGSAIDLCIVDGLSLHREWARLLTLRQRQEPVFLPVLLASDRGDVGLLTRELWRVVDDVIIRPIEKAELRVRLDTLLRARRLSLQLRRISGLYEHERRVALRLQEAALPNAFPSVPGLRFSAFYRPGSDEALIGGDWYDVLRLADGRIVFSVGDVSGAGLEAAVTMSDVRQVLRGVAQVHPDPGLMLDAADRTLELEGSERQVTAFVGVFDPVTGFLNYASAGHPPALLRLADGEIIELSTHELPLGVDQRAARLAQSAAIPDGALLVVHTDGLTEAGRDVTAGERALHRALRNPRLLERPNVALAIHDAVLDAESKDDVAILAMRSDRRGGRDDAIRRWAFDVHDAAVARATRDAVVRALRSAGFDGDALSSVELVYAELIGNVVRYAPGPVDVVLDLSAAAPVLHVLDRGSGFRMTPRLPYDDLSERGRGLFIVNELAAEFHVLHRSGGGSHASAVLRRDRRTG